MPISVMRLVASLLLLNFVAAKKEKKTEPLKEESKKDLSHGQLQCNHYWLTGWLQVSWKRSTGFPSTRLWASQRTSTSLSSSSFTSPGAELAKVHLNYGPIVNDRNFMTQKGVQHLARRSQIGWVVEEVRDGECAGRWRARGRQICSWRRIYSEDIVPWFAFYWLSWMIKVLLDTDGNLLTTNNERKYKNHKFFYPLIPQVIDGMERALDEFGEEKVRLVYDITFKWTNIGIDWR